MENHKNNTFGLAKPLHEKILLFTANHILYFNFCLLTRKNHIGFMAFNYC